MSLWKRLRFWVKCLILTPVVVTAIAVLHDPAPKQVVPEPPATTVADGAICRDGTRSYSIESGACSWHGGVLRWHFRPLTKAELKRDARWRAEFPELGNG